MRNTEALTRTVRAELARLTNTQPEDWFLVFRARYGVEAVLRSVREQQGSGEVITQPFTCTTALNPILSAGHIPTYVDTSYDDLSLDTTKLQASTASRAIIMQHSFGIESNVEKARIFANKHNLLLIEDSAHQLGMLAKRDGVPLVDVSVHSFGVEKLLPTKFGGAVWVNPGMNNSALRESIRTTLENLPVISRSQGYKARRYRGINRLLNHTPTFVEPSLRSLFISLGLFEPAIMPDELNGKNHSEPAKPNDFILNEMFRGLKNYKQTVDKRRHAAEIYRESLSTVDYTIPRHIPDNYAPVRFPVLCKDGPTAVRLFDTLRNNGHYSGKWYRPILFPGAVNPSVYNYDAESFPVAEDISARIINLPTNITAREAKEIADVLHG